MVQLPSPPSPPNKTGDAKIDTYLQTLYKWAYLMWFYQTSSGTDATGEEIGGRVALMFGLDGEDGEDGFTIPGPQGMRGYPGLTIPGMDGQDGEDGQIGITGRQGEQGVPGIGIPGMDGEDGDPGYGMGTVNAVSVVTANGLSGTSSGGATPALTLSLANSEVIGKVLTGFTAGAGVVAATDTILQAFNKTDGNVSARVVANAGITGATKTKITYDAKGLVTSGADATQDDIGDGTTYKQYSATEQSKLSGIAAGAEVNVQADWNQASSSADDYINNKPSIPTQYTDELAQDAIGNAVGNGLDYDDATGAVSVDETELVHNSIGSKQGGTTNEYYHLTSAELTKVQVLSYTPTDILYFAAMQG